MKASIARSCVLALTVLILAGLTPATGEAKPRDAERWDEHYKDPDQYLFGTQPIPFLKENIHLLPKGRAVDLAMGEGRNGVYLATQGFDVLGLDISQKGLDKAHKLAAHHGVKIETRVVDLETHQMEKNAYDLIVCTYYMQRSLFTQFAEALKPGGMAVIETYNTDYLKYAKFNPKYLLNENEMLEIFKNLKVIRYQAFDNGKVAFSSIIVQKY